jgi:hypothetical protein
MTIITYVTADASIPPPVDLDRNARGQYKAAGGSYIGKLLAFMGDKYNRERTLHSWPHARGRAYDQIAAHTGEGRRTIETYASIVSKLATNIKGRPLAKRTKTAWDADGAIVPVARDDEPDSVTPREARAVNDLLPTEIYDKYEYNPTLLLKLQGTSLDTADEMAALCRLAHNKHEMDGFLRAIRLGKSVSAISRRAEIKKRREANEDRQHELAKEISGWNQIERDRLLAHIITTPVKFEKVSAADLSISESIAAKTLHEIAQSGEAEVARLQHLIETLANLESKYRTLRLDATNEKSDILQMAKRIGFFLAFRKQAAVEHHDDGDGWLPDGDRDVLSNGRIEFSKDAQGRVDGYGFIKRSTKITKLEREEASLTVYANGDGGPLAIATRNAKMLEDVIRGLTRTAHEKDSEIAALRKRLRLANNKVAALNSQTPLDEKDEEPDAEEIEDEADEVTGYEQDAESNDE